MGTILIADDIVISRETLARVLREAGHRVISVASAEEAIERARGERPDMAILDLNMPRMTGIQAVPLLKAEFSGQLFPVMIVSGRALTAPELTQILAVAEDFLRKPYGTAEICARIEVWLRTRRLFEEQRRGHPSGSPAPLGPVPLSLSGPIPNSQPYRQPGRPSQPQAQAVPSPTPPGQPPGQSPGPSSGLPTTRPPFSGPGDRDGQNETALRLRPRPALIERIDEEWRRALRWNEPFALLLCQVVPVPPGAETAGPRDRGADAEAQMPSLARTLTRILRPIEILGLVEATRLAVLLTNTAPAAALAAAERLRGEVAGVPAPGGPSGSGFALCLGLALVPGRDIAGPDELYAAAEAALRRACEEGPGSLCLHQHQGYLLRDL